MPLTQTHLTNTFLKARETKAKFVFIAIAAEGVEEIIVIPSRSFDAKENFYKRAYNEQLVHCMNSNVHIRGLSYGDETELNNIA